MRSLLRLLSTALLAAGSLHSTAREPLDLAAAEAEYEELVREWEAEQQENPTPEAAIQLGLSLHALGVVQRQSGQASEARPHLERACELLARHAPAARIDAAEALALTLQDLGELASSETLLREVIESRPDDDPGRPASLDHLALNLLHQGRYLEVRPLLDQALEATPGHDLAGRARRLGHRAGLLHTLGNHARAVATLEDALRIPFDDSELRLSLRSDRALALQRLGDWEAAGKALDEVAEQARELYGDGLRSVPYINNLGAYFLEDGDAGAAASKFREALAILERELDADHPGLIQAFHNLGVALQASGELDEAEGMLLRAARLQSLHLPEVHLRVAETARNLARNALLRDAPETGARIDRAVSISLALLEELVRGGSERERLNFLERFDLLSLPCATGEAERIAAVLLASKARLFDALLRPGDGRPIPSWPEVQRALPADGAFIDTCHFEDVRHPGLTRYGAVVLLPDGPPRWVPLGTGDDLDRWLSAFHRRLRWVADHATGVAEGSPPALKLQTILRSMHRDFWEPLAEKLPEGTRHIAFSPDGALHFLPLAALLDADRQPLCRRLRQLTTVSSGRDLVAPPPQRGLGDAPWTVLTIDDFPAAPAAPDHDPLGTLLATLRPLPGTREEARRLRALAPRGSRFLRNAEVSENALAEIDPAPAALHLGCHAFFLADPRPDSLAIDFDQQAELLSSGGLVLYHGTQRLPGTPGVTGADDLLLPTEIARLPLEGTRLVTLSSCESGAGTPVSGEGLLGLRRAFALAGAREVMVALWPVADDSTPRFMDRFYRLALKSDRPGQALWQAQAEHLADPGDEAAFEASVLRFAPFSLSQSAPLRGGPTIQAARAPERRPNWLPWFTLIPLAVFLLARHTLRNRKNRRPIGTNSV